MKRNCLICGKSKQKVLPIIVKKDLFYRKKMPCDYNPILPKKVQREKTETSTEKLTSTLKGNADVTMNEDTKDDIQFLVNRFTDDANRVVPIHG